MKTLQNDFTTPEQSKLLLELGVPADSANMWWIKDEPIRINNEWVHGAGWSKVPDHLNWDRENDRFYTYSETKEIVEDFTGNDTLPCWSVGRLIEIYEICTGEIFERNDIYNIFSDIFTTIESALLNHKMDFSKLED